jgi:hypothetical protein
MRASGADEFFLLARGRPLKRRSSTVLHEFPGAELE